MVNQPSAVPSLGLMLDQTCIADRSSAYPPPVATPEEIVGQDFISGNDPRSFASDRYT
jgi:hypothetical protein